MVDYLEPVSKLGRFASIVCCTIASIICLLLSLIFWTRMIQQNNFYSYGRPLWLGVATISVVGIITGFIAWRLACRHAAANSVTLLPIWFIQLFGVLSLIGFCFASYIYGNVLFLVEGISLCLVMILIRRHIEKKQKAEKGIKQNNKDLDKRYKSAVSKQHAFNQATWSKLQEFGVTTETELELDFFYFAPSESEARALEQVLLRETDYKVIVDSEEGSNWNVSGTTKPTSVSLETLDQWTIWMITAGLQKNCEFDGWGTSCPE